MNKDHIECVLHRKRDMQNQNDVYVMRLQYNDGSLASATNLGSPKRTLNTIKSSRQTSIGGGSDSLEEEIIGEGIHRLPDAQKLKERQIRKKFANNPG